MAKGKCELCGVSSSNMTTHRKTKKHIEAVKAAEAVKDEPVNTQPDIDEPESMAEPDEARAETTKPASKNATIAGIQIIDGNTNKPAKNWVDSLLEFAFAPDVAPVTLSLLDGLAKRLSNTNNKEVSEGRLVRTVSGATYEAAEGF